MGDENGAFASFGLLGSDEAIVEIKIFRGLR